MEIKDKAHKAIKPCVIWLVGLSILDIFDRSRLFCFWSQKFRESAKVTDFQK